MSFLKWLFGKKEEATSAGQQAAPTRPAGKESSPPVATVQTPRPSEADNLRRWRESGQPRAWVEARQGRWDHAAWLGLLEELKRSSYWPMSPEEVGKVLEAAKQEWLRRN